MTYIAELNSLNVLLCLTLVVARGVSDGSIARDRNTRAGAVDTVDAVRGAIRLANDRGMGSTAVTTKLDDGEHSKH